MLGRSDKDLALEGIISQLAELDDSLLLTPTVDLKVH